MTLADYITRHLRVPFFYGKHDCVLFAFGWVQEKTGRDLLADLPKWKGEKQAMLVINSVGGLEAGVDARLTPINPHLAKDGDVGMANGMLGLYSGAHLVAPDADGLKFVSRMLATAAWSAD